MALSMKSNMTARVAGRRVGAFRTPGAVAVPVRPTFVSAKTAAPAVNVGRISRASAVTVKAVKKSVGDLKRSDLENKRVFVRAGEYLEQ